MLAAIERTGAVLNLLPPCSPDFNVSLRRVPPRYPARSARRPSGRARVAAPGQGVARQEFFVFLSDRRVPPTNNGSEQEIRPSVIFRKVANGFCSDWGPGIHTGYRTFTGTARRQGQSAWTAIQALVGETSVT